VGCLRTEGYPHGGDLRRLPTAPFALSNKATALLNISHAEIPKRTAHIGGAFRNFYRLRFLRERYKNKWQLRGMSDLWSDLPNTPLYFLFIVKGQAIVFCR